MKMCKMQFPLLKDSKSNKFISAMFPTWESQILEMSLKNSLFLNINYAERKFLKIQSAW